MPNPSKLLKKENIWSWFPVTLLTAVFCCVLWGSATPAIKIAYQQFGIPADDTASRIVLSPDPAIVQDAMTSQRAMPSSERSFFFSGIVSGTGRPKRPASMRQKRFCGCP